MQLLSVARDQKRKECLHKSTSTDALRISRTREDAATEGLNTPASNIEVSRIKTLEEICNLIELFYRNGFSTKYSEGEDWLKMRSVLRQLIMRPSDVAVFSDDVNHVVDDLVQRVCVRCEQAVMEQLSSTLMTFQICHGGFFPVLPGNGRITQDNLVVGGYLIPKGLALCHFATSLEEEDFPDALEFRPQRWIRKDATDCVDNFGSIPFGHGIRSCIGKRISELEMHLSLTRLIQRFHIGVSPLTAEVKAKTHGLLCPAAHINLQFIDRQH